MTRTLLPETNVNGGFPEPPPSEPIRVVAARHSACGEATRVRLPRAVPVRAVRRMHCSCCAQPFDADRVEEVSLDDFPAAQPAPAPRVELPKLVMSKAKPKQGSAPAAKPVAEPAVAAAAGAAATAESAAAAKAGAAKTRSLSLPKLTLPQALRRKPGTQPDAPAKPGEPRGPRRLGLPKVDPDSAAWRLASVAIAAVAVVVVLMLLQGGDSSEDPAAPATDVPEVTGEAAAGGAGGAASPAADGESAPAPEGKSKFISGDTYSLLLPGGWQQVEGADGSTFSAVAPDGAADVTLWIEEDPKLDFPEFVTNSMAQLEALAGSAEVIERVPAPSPDDSVVKLGADSPPGEPSYEALLRAAGPYRYYLAFTVQPDAPSEVIEGKDLLEGSFTPEAKG